MYSRLKNGLRVGVASLVKWSSSSPIVSGSTGLPIRLFPRTHRHDKETSRPLSPHGGGSHTKAAAFVNRVFRKASQVHRDTILFDLDSDTDEEEEDRISIHKEVEIEEEEQQKEALVYTFSN